jgi:spermidine synthase
LKNASEWPARRPLLLAAVFLTGATALAYEVAWARGLSLLLGSTAVTAAVVLGVFVGGLGLGARLGARWADRTSRPLALYGALEVLGAAWAAGALLLAGLLEGPYAALAGPLGPATRLPLRVLFAAAVVLPGALVLGATLPALVRHAARGAGAAGRTTAWIYGANTLGAVAGCLGAGLGGIEAFGVQGFLLGAAMVGGAVGAGAIVVGRRGEGVPPPEALAAPAGAGRATGPLAAALLSGLVGIGAEIAGFRVLVFFVEGFTATLAAMLGTFILGLGLSSAALGPRLATTERPARALGVLLLAAGLVLLLEWVLLIPRLEALLAAVKASAYRGVADVGGIARALAWTALAGSAATLLLPALCLGATFPLCVRWAELSGWTPARAVGSVYLWNSAGVLLAPPLVGFAAMAWLGAGGAWVAVALLAAFGGAALLLGRGRLGPLLVAPVLAAGVAAVLGPSPARLVEASHVLSGRPERRLDAVASDAVTTASVVRDAGGELTLYTDDFAAAATGRHYRYMRMLGHLPALLAADPSRAMVVAFGTGTTAGAVAAHPGVSRLEVVEVSRAVLDLAPWFEVAHRGVLADPRVSVLVDDGRGALALHEGGLGVITLEPLMPYSPAGLPFYTEEFYRLARSRLAPGGVLCQWVPVHAMPAGLYAAFLATFFRVFPDGEVWFFEQSTALLGFRDRVPLDETTLARRREAVAADLEDAGLPSLEHLLAARVAGGRRVLAAPPPPSPWAGRVVRDLDPFPEFHPTPRASLVTTWLEDTLAWLALLVEPADPSVPASVARADALRRSLAARSRQARAEGLLVASRYAPRAVRAVALTDALAAYREAADLYGQSLDRLPGERVLLGRRAEVVRGAARLEVEALRTLAAEARAGGRAREADDHLRAAEGVARRGAAVDDPDPGGEGAADAALFHAEVLLELGRCAEAGAALAAAEARVAAGPARDRVGALRASLDRAREAGGSWTAPGGRPLPPCGAEGFARVEAEHALWWSALAEGLPQRALEQRADALREAARREGVEAALAERLRGDPLPAGAAAQAIRAGLLGALDSADPTLTELLASPDEDLLLAALAEAGRRRVLRGLVHGALPSSPSPAVRAAFADAAGADGFAGLLCRLADLLLDPDLRVRVSAATALLRHDTALLSPYDPSAPEPARAAIAAKVRERFCR